MRITSQSDNVPVLHAYLNSPLPETVINRVYADFALGSHHHTIVSQVQLSIHDELRFHGATAEEVRTALDAEGRGEEQFLLITNDVEETRAVWYVDRWKDDDDEDEDVVQHGDEPVLWKLRVMTVAVPPRWVDYSIGNSSVQEDLDHTTSFPYDPHAPQTPYTHGILDDPDFSIPAYVVAEPGEFEQGPGDNLDVMPRQETVYKLKEDIARQFGLISDWAIGWRAGPHLNAPEGSMCFTQRYDPGSEEWRAPQPEQ